VELREYLSILWRRKVIISITFLMTIFVTAVVTALMKPEYQATALIRVFTASTGSTYELDYSDRLMNTYSVIATSRPMLSNLAAKVGLKTPPQVAVQALANSELMQITVTYQEPALAARAADTLASMLIAYSRTMASSGSTSGPAYAITIVQHAYAPTSPVSPRKAINLAVGVLLGLVGGIGLAVLFENLDPRAAEFSGDRAILRDGMPDSFEDTSSTSRSRMGCVQSELQNMRGSGKAAPHG
jgi:polysaccharide biosynthesis transport protein